MGLVGEWAGLEGGDGGGGLGRAGDSKYLH